jgi:hypothetical protein
MAVISTRQARRTADRSRERDDLAPIMARDQHRRRVDPFRQQDPSSRAKRRRPAGLSVDPPFDPATPGDRVLEPRTGQDGCQRGLKRETPALTGWKG